MLSDRNRQRKSCLWLFYNHYKRIIEEERIRKIHTESVNLQIPDPNVPEPVEIAKSNMLMIDLREAERLISYRRWPGF